MEPALIALVLACAVSLLLSGVSLAWVIAFSKPARLLQQSQRLDSIQADWVAFKASMEGVLESIDGQLESVERKRRQVAGAASRVQNAVEPQGPPTRAEILRPYRQAAFGSK